MKREKLIVDLSGPGGNIFFLLAKVRDIMVKQNRSAEFEQLWAEIQKGGYSRALYLINQKVEIIDTSEQKILQNELKVAKKLYKLSEGS